MFQSQFFNIPDKILDEKTFRLRRIMHVAAQAITGTAYCLRVLPPFALSVPTACSLAMNNTPESFICFSAFSLSALLGCLGNAFLTGKIYNAQRRAFFSKPELVFFDTPHLTSAKSYHDQHAWLLKNLRSCFVCLPDNIWFKSLAFTSTEDSPAVEFWKAVRTGLKLGLRHNALRSFGVPASYGEKIMFRLDTAAYRAPISAIDKYGDTDIKKFHFIKRKWKSPSNPADQMSR